MTDSARNGPSSIQRPCFTPHKWHETVILQQENSPSLHHKCAR